MVMNILAYFVIPIWYERVYMETSSVDLLFSATFLYFLQLFFIFCGIPNKKSPRGTQALIKKWSSVVQQDSCLG